MYIRENDDVKYVIDPARLPEIEFPIYHNNAFTAYYTPSGKTVFVPLKYRFKKGATDQVVKLEGQLILPKDEAKVKASCNVPMDIVCDAFINSMENDKSLLGDVSFAKYARVIAEYLKETFIETSANFICLNSKYQYPAFIFCGSKLIAVSNSVEFYEDEFGDLMMKASNPKGPFVSEYSKTGGTLKAVILDHEGEKITEVVGRSGDINDNIIEISVTDVVRTGTTEQLKECQHIYKEYRENYIAYFVEKETAEKEVNEVEIFV